MGVADCGRVTLGVYMHQLEEVVGKRRQRREEENLKVDGRREEGRRRGAKKGKIRRGGREEGDWEDSITRFVETTNWPTKERLEKLTHPKPSRPYRTHQLRRPN